MEEKEKWGRRCKKLLDDFEQMRRYRKLKEEALSGELALEDAMDLSQHRQHDYGGGGDGDDGREETA